ncbi:GNAT family N-acetyltransferase [Moorena producens]|uniref:GNAT family N-acetyltransferase n=1 Tax=Moorena producens TaxID=1155739 RepID=UPI0009F4CF66|nr:GNAT family N-acetyltransferase [Moorena producens]
MDSCFSFLTLHKSVPTGQDTLAGGISQVTIRAAQSEDISTLADILADSFHPQKGLISWVHPLLRLGIYEDLRHRLRSSLPHYLCLVAVTTVPDSAATSQLLAGTVELTLRSRYCWPKPNCQHLYISNLAVRKSCRRQGVGENLLLACEQTALEWGFQDLYLHVLENNYQARQLYLKRGYELDRVEPSYTGGLLRLPKRLLLHKQINPAGLSLQGQSLSQ